MCAHPAHTYHHIFMYTYVYTYIYDIMYIYIYEYVLLLSIFTGPQSVLMKSLLWDFCQMCPILYQ